MTNKMHVEEFEIDESLVLHLLTEQFPSWAHLPIKRVVSSGTDNALFRLGDTLCVRLPRMESAASKIQKSHAWLSFLAPKLPLPIPTPVEMGKPCERFLWPWSISTWLSGGNAYQCPLRDLTQTAYALAHFLTSLHQIQSNNGPTSRRAGSLCTQNDEVEESLYALQYKINKQKVSNLWCESLAASPWQGAPVWTHGDLLPPNLLVERGRLSAVIDFDLMGVGDPACDLMVAWSVLSKKTRPIFRKALGLDHDTWLRGRGWALSVALIIIPYYERTNPVLTAIAYRMIDEICADTYD